MPGSQGKGWGGPAKGAGKGPAKPFTAESPTRQTIPGGKGDPVKMDARAEKRARDEVRAEELRDHLYTLATKAERQETQLSAAVAFLNRVEGMPVAKQQVEIKRPIEEMTEAELASAIELIRATIAGNAEGAGSGGREAGGGKPH